MPYPCFEKKCRRIKCLLYTPVFFISINIIAQSKWDGDAGDGQWTTAANWVGDNLPLFTDDVLLDNSIVVGNYIVSLPASAPAITIKTIAISPAAGNNIQLTLPVSNMAMPAFTVTGPGYGITINNGGLFLNSSGAASGAAIAVNDSFRINNGGQYIHNTRSAHALMVTALSKQPGTETGIFKFDVPGGGYTFSVTNRTYGTLILSSDASGGSQSYAASAANPLTINGDLIIKPGANVNLDITAATFIKGNYIQEGGVFNLASQANNNIVYIKGNFIQTGGSVTETSTGLPAIELSGTTNQNIRAAGNITNSVSFRINNNAGISLLTNLSLPYNLNLINGIVNTQSFLITLLAGCSIQADSVTSNSFINGPLRKEGLSAAPYFLFPVGKDITQRWVELKDATGNYTVEFFKSNPKTLASVNGAGIHHISSIEYWSIDADAAPSPIAAVNLSFDNVNSGGVTDMSTLRVVQLLSGAWTDKGNTATTGTAGSAGSVISNALNVFGPTGKYFALASSDAFQNPLPLKPLVLNGNTNGKVIVLNWTIESLWQPAYFELQSSADGNHFITLLNVDAVVNQFSYQCTDKRKLTGNQYYRLRLIEKDGTFFYSNTIRIAAGINAVELIQLWPSLVKANASLSINAIDAKQVQVNIYNMEGKVVQAIHVFLQPGRNIIPLQLQGLAAGVYTISVQDDGSKTNGTRFVKSN